MSVLMYTGVGAGEPRIEEGVIERVHTGEGVCEVTTASGRRLFKVHITTPMGGPAGQGLIPTPLAGASCLVVYFLPDTENRSYLLSTFQQPRSAGPLEGFESPGDFTYRTATGGHLLVSQTGVMDLLSDPWCRVSLLPDDQVVKVMVKSFEMHLSPLSALRIVQDSGEDAEFMELMINSRFLGRDNDEDPDIIWTLGDSTLSERVHEANPRSERLSYFHVESRARTDGSRLIRSYTEEIGNDQGEMLRETVNSVAEESSHMRRVGDMEGVIEEHVITTPETLIEHRRGHFDGKLEELLFVVGDRKLQVTVHEDGRVLIENPAWTIDIESGDKLTIESAKTKVLIDGANIYLGGTDGSEPIVHGNKLVELLNDMIAKFNSHNHFHPQGPTTGIMAPYTKPVKILSSVNHAT
jgi:hypothetical protein